MLSGLTDSLKRYVSFKPNDENEAVNKKRPLSCDSDTSHGNYGAQKRHKLSSGTESNNFVCEQEFDEPLTNYLTSLYHWVTDIPSHNYFIQKFITALRYPFERQLIGRIYSFPEDTTEQAMKLSSKRTMLHIGGNETEQKEGKLTRASLRSNTRRQDDWPPAGRRLRRTPTKDSQLKLDYADRHKGKNCTSSSTPKVAWQKPSRLSNGISNNEESWETVTQKRPRASKSGGKLRAFTAEESVRLHEKEQYKMLLQQFTSESLFHTFQRSPVYMKDAQVQSDFSWTTKDNKHHYPHKFGTSVVRKEKLNPNETCSLIKLLKSNPRSSYEVGKSKDCFIVSSIEKKPNLSSSFQEEKPKKEIPNTNDDDSIIITKVVPPKIMPTSSKHRDTSFFSPKWLEELRQTINAQGKKFVEDSKREEEKLSLMREKRQAAHAKEEEEIKERLRRKNIAVLEENDDDDENQLADFPELTTEMDASVDDALRTNPPDEILAEGFRLSVARRDMETLAGLNWLNDEIINFYMNLLMERSKLDNFPTVYAFNTFFYTKLLNSGHSALRRWTRKVDIFSYDMLLVPVHMGMHWCLAVIDFRHKRIQYYDSMGGQNAECLNALKTYLQDERMDKKKEDFDMSGWTLETVKNIPHQMNGSDCGMFALKYAEYITRDAKINFLQNHMPYFRRRMVYEILKKRLL